MSEQPRRLQQEKFLELRKNPPPELKPLVEQYNATFAKFQQTSQAIVGNQRKIQSIQLENQKLDGQAKELRGACGALSDAIALAYLAAHPEYPGVDAEGNPLPSPDPSVDELEHELAGDDTVGESDSEE